MTRRRLNHARHNQQVRVIRQSVQDREAFVIVEQQACARCGHFKAEHYVPGPPPDDRPPCEGETYARTCPCAGYEPRP